MPSPLRRLARPRIGGTGRGEIDRIIFFSDAVFAIAITLLVIQIAVPSARLHRHDLTNALLALGPRYFSFGLSFWVIGRFWIAHHVTFRHVVRWGSGLLFLNLLLLMGISFLPFPTAVIGSHLSDAPAAVFYALSIAFTGLASSALWWYASRNHRLIDPNVSRGHSRLQLLRALTTPFVFLASLPAIPVLVDFGLGRVSLATVLWIPGIPVLRALITRVLGPRLETDHSGRSSNLPGRRKRSTATPRS